jgi:hypothetical protein
VEAGREEVPSLTRDGHVMESMEDPSQNPSFKIPNPKPNSPFRITSASSASGSSSSSVGELL